MRLISSEASYEHAEVLEFYKDDLCLFCYWNIDARIWNICWKRLFDSSESNSGYGYHYPFTEEKLDLR